MRNHCVIIALICCVATLARGGEHTKDSLAQVQKNLAEKKAVLVDVRERKEWDRGHLQAAQLMPLSELNRGAGDPAFQEKLAKDVPRDRIVYCHCAKGVRAATAGDILNKLGYDVRPLAAGFDELRQNGFPVAKDAASP